MYLLRLYSGIVAMYLLDCTICVNFDKESIKHLIEIMNSTEVIKTEVFFTSLKSHHQREALGIVLTIYRVKRN